MAFTEHQVREFAEAWKRRMAAQRGRVDPRREALLGKLDAAAALVRQAGAQRVWLIGSLAWGLFDKYSDVDLVVLGLPAAAELDARRAVEALLDCRVDLLPLELLDVDFAQRVIGQGRKL